MRIWAESEGFHVDTALRGRCLCLFSRTGSVRRSVGHGAKHFARWALQLGINRRNFQLPVTTKPHRRPQRYTQSIVGHFGPYWDCAVLKVAHVAMLVVVLPRTTTQDTLRSTSRCVLHFAILLFNMTECLMNKYRGKSQQFGCSLIALVSVISLIINARMMIIVIIHHHHHPHHQQQKHHRQQLPTAYGINSNALFSTVAAPSYHIGDDDG